ncbi:MAG: methyltransferase domain-containing protein, partial [Alphaproteobacteria bacterium]|nr:methyltransferase domain-containing protein [Alphaproteobacteria bacterium]
CNLGLDARVMSGESLLFENEFDAILSNAALHWMKKTDAVLAGAYRALKKDGRFVAEMGGAGNVSKICAALKLAMEKRGLDFDSAYPWYFPTVEDYQKKLIAAGFKVEAIKLFARPTPLPGDIAGWLSTFAGSFLSALEQSQWSDLIDEVRDILSPDLKQDEGLWYADYMRLRFVAIKS